MTLLIFWSASARPASRSLIFPDWTFSRICPKVSWYAGPDEVGGVVDEFGLLKMSMNVLKSASLFSVGSASAFVVVGTFLSSPASLTIAWSFVVRYLISSQAASGFLAFLLIPRMLPVT